MITEFPDSRKTCAWQCQMFRKQQEAPASSKNAPDNNKNVPGSRAQIAMKWSRQ